MRSHVIGLCLLFVSVNVLADVPDSLLPERPKPEKALSWRLAASTQVEWWILRHDVYHHSYYFGWTTDHPSETFHPSPHLMVRPEFLIRYRQFSCRVIGSFSAQTNLKEKIEGYSEEPATVGFISKGRWYSGAIEFGYGGKILTGYLGYRYWKISIDPWPDTSLYSYGVGDAVVGMRLHSTRQFGKEGLLTNMNMYMGLSPLVNIYSREGVYTKPLTAGISLDMGWQPDRFPIGITIGYGIEMFAKYLPSLSRKEHWHHLASFVHGAYVTLSWSQ